MPEPTTARDETTAMGRIAKTLDELDPAARARVVRWIGERYSRPAAEGATE